MDSSGTTAYRLCEFVCIDAIDIGIPIRNWGSLVAKKSHKEVITLGIVIEVA
jgi:hypothetical protein